MAITFTFDNDSLTDGDQQLTLDETAGLQTVDDTGSADGDFVDPDDDVELTYVAGVLGGSLDADFLNYLNALTLFDDKDAAFTFAAGAEGASSTSSFITATPTAGEEISDLFFSINPAVPSGLISGMTTLDGAALYFHIDPSNNDRAIVTTSETAGEGRIVAAFYLDEDDTDHLTAQVQMVTFEAIKHPDGTNPDDAVAFTDVLQISAAGTTSFDFDELPSGSFLWVAIGSSNAGLLVTGDDLNVNTDSGSNKYGQFITGGSDPSDTMNTSQGGAGATIGVNSQHFVRGAKVNGVYQDGSIADFTLVSQLDTLASSSSATGTNIQDIDYGGYIQTVGASLFISQLTGTHADMRVQLFNADADGNAGNGYQVEEGFGYLGDNTTDAELHDDLAVAVGSVTVHHNGVDYVFLASGADIQTQGDITVTFETYGGVENSFTVTGADALDTIDWTAASGATFNRFKVQALGSTDAFDVGRIDIAQGVTESAGLGSHLFVDDDGPTLAAANASARVEEDELATGITDNDLFTATATLTNADLQAIVNTGADEPVSFDLNLAVTGAVLDVDGNAMTSKGVAMTWSESGGVVSAMAGARTVFTITQTAGAATTSDPTDDVFTVVLLDQLDHPAASGDSGIETINLTPAFSAADYDLDALTLTGPKIQLVVENDVPAITSQILNSVVDVSGPVSSATKSLNGAIGADENNATNITSAGVKTYTFDNYTTPTNVWSTLTAVLSATGDTINYYESSAVGADLVYSIVLDQANAGQYTFTVHKAAPSEKLEFDFSDLPSGQNLFGVLADREAGVLQVDGPGLLVVGRDAVLAANGSYTNASDTINTSKGGGGVTIGIDNQMFDPGDGAVFVFLDNADDKSIGGAGLTQTSADDADTLGFEDLLPVQGAELEVVQKQGGAPCGMKITAYYVTPHDTAADGAKIVSANDPEAKAPPTTDDVSADARSFIDNPLDGGTIVSITTVNVYDRANPSNILTSATIDQDTGVVTYVDGDADGVIDHASGVDVTASETSAGSDIWTVTVTGFDGNDTIAYETAADHNAVLTEGTGGKWDLGGFNLTQGQDTPDQKFDFSVLVNDYDGDSYGAQSEVTIFDDFSIGIDGTGQFDDGMVAGVLI